MFRTSWALAVFMLEPALVAHLGADDAVHRQTVPALPFPVATMASSADSLSGYS
jgi:hypothetical protein